MTFNICWRVIVAAGSLGLWLSCRAEAQTDSDENRASKELSIEEMNGVVAQAEKMLRIIVPQDERTQKREPWKIVKLSDGTIYWGNFIRADEKAALVNVKPAGEDSDLDPLPQYLSYFIWKKGRWEFQQFLGNAYGLTVHYREDRPAVFLQGYYRSGRYDGEFLSWYFDPKSSRFERTHFEDWGPFALKENYLLTERGFERLAHDTTTRIYEYRDGKKGKFIAECHQNDSGDFSITCHDGRLRRWRQWNFHQDRENESHMEVRVVEIGDNPDIQTPPQDGFATKTAEIQEQISLEHVFQRLTGLNPALLEVEWANELPPAPLVKWNAIEAKGNPEIIEFFQTGLNEQRRQEEKRVLKTVQDLTPHEKIVEAQIISEDVRGIWGKLLGGKDFWALVSTGLPGEGESVLNSRLFLLNWEGEWNLRQTIGLVSGAVDYNGELGWCIKRDESREVFYLLSQRDLAWADALLMWRFDPATKTFVPVKWEERGLPSIAGDILTFSSSNPAFDVERTADIYQFSGKVGPWIGSMSRGYSSEHLARFWIKVWDESSKKPITWRLWRTKRGYSTNADTYSLCRDEGDGNTEFREDAVLKFNWGEYGYSEMDAALFMWWRLTGIGSNPVLGIWSKETHSLRRKPLSVGVTGLPDAVERFTFSENQHALRRHAPILVEPHAFRFQQSPFLRHRRALDLAAVTVDGSIRCDHPVIRHAGFVRSIPQRLAHGAGAPAIELSRDPAIRRDFAARDFRRHGIDAILKTGG